MPTSLPPQIEQFLHDNPQGVMTSFRRNGMPQLSIVTVYPRDGGVGISITETRAKFKNLLRDPRCSVLVSHADWWSGFLVFEGRAELTHSGNTAPEPFARLAAASSARPPDGGAPTGPVRPDHRGRRRVAVIVRPDHIYGSALAKMRDAVTNSLGKAQTWRVLARLTADAREPITADARA
jgi:PPOX class probable F420-dependent enzyme